MTADQRLLAEAQEQRLLVEAEAKRLFASLAAGGQVQQPLIKTFFSSSFGVVADRFGVSWMIYVAP